MSSTHATRLSHMLSSIVLKTQSDETLVRLAAQGSEPAFEAIVQRYRRQLLGYCRRLLLSDPRSEDVVQQSLLNAWTALRHNTEVQEIRPWLYRITHNQAMSALRRPGWDYSELNESLLQGDPCDSDLERRIVVRETLAAVAALPERQRQAILRTAIEGRSYEQVAEDLGVSEKAVRGLVYRARCTLRTGLAAVAPAPLVLWAAGQTRRCGLAEWLPEVLGGGGGAGGAAVVAKGAAVLVSSAAIIGGTVRAVVEPHPAAASVRMHRSEALHVDTRRGRVAPERPVAQPGSVGGSARLTDGPARGSSPRTDGVARPIDGLPLRMSGTAFGRGSTLASSGVDRAAAPPTRSSTTSTASRGLSGAAPSPRGQSSAAGGTSGQSSAAGGTSGQSSAAGGKSSTGNSPTAGVAPDGDTGSTAPPRSPSSIAAPRASAPTAEPPAATSSGSTGTSGGSSLGGSSTTGSGTSTAQPATGAADSSTTR